MPLTTTQTKLQQQLPSSLLEATVLDPPTDSKGWLRVEVASQKGVAVTCPWTPRLDVPAQPGDAAVVVESDEGNYWCVTWWPQTGAAGASYAPLDGTGHVPLALLPVLDWAHLPTIDVAHLPAQAGPTAIDVRGVGITGSKRAGRKLTVADFTTLLGLSAPIALYGLDTVNDSSGNGRTLTATTTGVQFGTGITGLANDAARFVGSNVGGLFIADANGGPFNFRTGTFGCWFKTAKRNISQRLMAKGTNVAGSRGWMMSTDTTNVLKLIASTDSTNQMLLLGSTSVDDEFWHFGVGTYDGTYLRLYVDGQLDGVLRAATPGDLAQNAQPFNIGSAGITAVAGTGSDNTPTFGLIDEAFVHGDVLNEDQIRLLMAASVAHGLTSEPSGVSVKVRRYRRGGPLATADFPATPRRLYNFTNTAVTDQGLDGQNMIANGGVTSVDGIDGTLRDAKAFPGVNTAYMNTVPPAAFTGAARSVGCWFQTLGNAGAQMTLLALSGGTATDWRPLYIQANGVPATFDGTALGADGGEAGLVANCCDGLPHYWVAVWDNAASDGLKRKVYLDGRLVGSDTSFTTPTIGTGSFYLGILGNATEPYRGLLDGLFVCDYALTAEQIMALFAKGSKVLPAAPFDESVVEGMDATNLYLLAERIDPQHKLDIKVAA